MRTKMLILLAALLLAPSWADGTVLRRFVLVAGANNGGSERATLRYAVSDAENFVRVLEAMGGVEEEDIFVLREPTSASFTRALSDLQDKVTATPTLGTRREVVVYYSGHADDRGLLLGDDRLSYQSLRQQIDDIQADVHITVLDACASGAITRLKGGHRRQAFLVDESSRMRGYAFLTSSSEDEAAQESDRIGASYFTHYLVSGMRGAADASGDGKVTLGEAYQFAFHETLNTTAETQAGAQHPSYDINLTGTGDVVMTDIRQVSAGLIVDKSLHGRLFIRNEDEQLVAELYKVAGRSIELGLEPGNYQIHFDQEPARFKADIEIKDGERFSLEPENLYAVGSEETTLRGAESEDDLRSLSLGILDKRKKPFNGIQLSLIGNRAEQGTGTQISPYFNISEGGVSGGQYSIVVNKTAEDGKYVQLAVGLNVAEKDFKGMQLSSVVNVTQGRMDGVQIGTANFGGTLDGMQLSIINIAQKGLGSQIGVANLSGGRFKGFQLGTLNVVDGMMGGLQIGVVNLANDLEGVQLGVFNATWKGLMHTGSFIDETGMPYYTITTGARWWYSYYAIGYNPYVTEEPYAFGFGTGGQIKVHDRLFFEIDAGATMITTEKAEFHMRTSSSGNIYEERPWNVHSRLRGMAGIKLTRGAWLYGGISFNVLSKKDDAPVLLRPRGDYAKRLNDNIQMWPGFLGGIRFGRS
jgi:hypothetical protein